MRGGKQPCFVLAAALLFAGCSSPQFRRIDANRELYESWPIDVRQAVLDGKVEAGMTPDMVKVAWGKPTEIISRSSTPGDEEIWVYRTGGDPDPMMTRPVIMSPTVGISTGHGGTVLGGNMGTGIGMGGHMGTGSVGMRGTGVMMPMPTPMPPTPVEEREVVFRNGVVYRADSPK